MSINTVLSSLFLLCPLQRGGGEDTCLGLCHILAVGQGFPSPSREQHRWQAPCPILSYGGGELSLA